MYAATEQNKIIFQPSSKQTIKSGRVNAYIMKNISEQYAALYSIIGIANAKPTAASAHNATRKGKFLRFFSLNVNKASAIKSSAIKTIL